MLEGLEIAEIDFSFVSECDNRLEAKFYTSPNFKLSSAWVGADILKSSAYNSIYGVDNKAQGHLVLRMNEFDHLFAGVPTMRSSNFTDEDFEFHRLRKNDVLICRTNGNPDLVGKSALVAKDYDYVYESHLFKVIPDEDLIKSAVLVVYLNCRYGKMEIARHAMQGNQSNFSLSKFKLIKIPKFGQAFQFLIEKLVYSAFSDLEASKSSGSNAETVLLQALNLSNWQAPEPLSYTRSSSDAFTAGRLDAEHFQPKFQALLAHLLATGRAKTLGDILLLNQRGKQPDYVESSAPVVNSKHINKGEVRIDSDNRCAQTDDETVLIQPGDVVMNGTGVGTIGRAAPYLHNFGAVPDNHVTILKPKPGMDAVYLSVFINSLAGQMQVAQRLRGSSGQIELYPNDIARFMVWDAPEEVQASIRQLVIQSFEAKQRATQLLDAAKRAVEIAIEDSESAALDYLALFE